MVSFLLIELELLYLLLECSIFFLYGVSNNLGNHLLVVFDLVGIW